MNQVHVRFGDRGLGMWQLWMDAPGGGVLVSDLGAPFRFTGKAAGLVVRLDGRAGRQERVYTNRVSRRRGGAAEFARPGGVLIEPPPRPE